MFSRRELGKCITTLPYIVKLLLINIFKIAVFPVVTLFFVSKNYSFHIIYTHILCTSVWNATTKCCSLQWEWKKQEKSTENQKIITSFSANTPVNLILMEEKKTIQMSNYQKLNYSKFLINSNPESTNNSEKFGSSGYSFADNWLLNFVKYFNIWHLLKHCCEWPFLSPF